MYDYNELKVLIIRKYGTIRNFCKETKLFKESHICRLLSGELTFSMRNIEKLISHFGIAKRDIGSYFFTLKVSKNWYFKENKLCKKEKNYY